MKNLAHRASLHAMENNAPSTPGINSQSIGPKSGYRILEESDA
jgi:hypothetical protein